MANEAVIVAYGRTAMTKARKPGKTGGLSQIHPVDYLADTLKGVVERLGSDFDPTLIEDVIIGCAKPINELELNPARLAVFRAGLPDSIPGQTINRFCSSGLQAIATASNAISMGQAKCIIAGGVESMTKCNPPYPDEHKNPWIKENYEGGYMLMGETAERVADKYDIKREDMDKAAYESHVKAAAARAQGKFKNEIIPITDGEGNVIDYDDGIQADLEGNLTTSLEKISSLRTVFRENGRICAAACSQVTDAAALVCVMEKSLAESLGLKPLAKLVGFSVAGCDPTLMGLGPIYAVPKVLEQTGLTIDDMDVIEINEAFASQALACINELKMPEEKVNPWGGAMALGHPMGATGAILTMKAIDYLKDKGCGKYAMVTMCIGEGMGAAGIYEVY